MLNGMDTHVVLLRGINVGGRHKLPMAPVREHLTAAGFGDVATHLQSGNVVLRSPDGPTDVAHRVSALLTEVAGFPVPAIALPGDELVRLLDQCPFQPTEPRLAHVVVLPSPVDDALRSRLEDLRGKDTTDDDLAVGQREVYLSHPGGLAGSVLARRATAQLPDGTARNLATLGALARLVAERA